MCCLWFWLSCECRALHVGYRLISRVPDAHLEVKWLFTRDSDGSTAKLMIPLPNECLAQLQTLCKLGMLLMIFPFQSMPCPLVQTQVWTCPVGQMVFPLHWMLFTGSYYSGGFVWRWQRFVKTTERYSQTITTAVDSWLLCFQCFQNAFAAQSIWVSLGVQVGNISIKMSLNSYISLLVGRSPILYLAVASFSRRTLFDCTGRHGWGHGSLRFLHGMYICVAAVTVATVPGSADCSSRISGSCFNRIVFFLKWSPHA